jgi:hypothetical protein
VAGALEVNRTVISLKYVVLLLCGWCAPLNSVSFSLECNFIHLAGILALCGALRSNTAVRELK